MKRRDSGYESTNYPPEIFIWCDSRLRGRTCSSIVRAFDHRASVRHRPRRRDLGRQIPSRAHGAVSILPIKVRETKVSTETR
jgi:hypothetical protein